MLGNWPKGIIDDRYDFYMEGYDAITSMIDTIFEIKNPTQGAFDQRTSAIGMGVLQQKTVENTSVTYRRPAEAFTAYCAYQDFDDGISLTRNEVDDFPVQKVRDLMKTTIGSWGEKVRLTEDSFAATLFTAGGFTGGHANFKAIIPNVISQQAGGLAYDGFPFFNLVGNLRSSKGGGTYYNSITGPLNVANYGLLDNLLFVTNAKSERDERVATRRMGKVILLFPPQLRDEAVQTLKSEYLPGGNLNDRNPWFEAAALVEWQALITAAGTSAMTGTWFIGVAKKGISFYRRGKPEIRMFRDEDTGAYKATIRARYGFMPWDFRFWGSSNSPVS